MRAGVLTGDTAALPTGDRCPQCRGLVRADAAWCTQCWADLRPPPPSPAPSASPPASPPAPADAVLPSGALPTGSAPAGTVGRPPGGSSDGAGSRPGGWPCSGCGAANPVELDACAACGTAFLAGLRKQEPPLLVLPGVGDLMVLSRGQRLGLAAGVALAVAVLTAVLSLLLS